MFKLSPRFLLSPRFFALPVVALAIIFALAQAQTPGRSTAAQVAGPIVKATTCSATTKTPDAACATARDTTRALVR